MSRIFDPKKRAPRASAGDRVGRFRSGHQLSGKPVSLQEWRITTDDSEVAQTVADLFGGEPQQWETKGDDDVEVFTEAAEVGIILDPERGVDAHFYIWPRGQKRIVNCDGDVVEVEGRKPIECTSGTFTTKAEYEEEEHVCDPQVRVRFRLQDAPDLGTFEFQSGAWSLVTEVGPLLYDLSAYDGSVLATLGLEVVEYETQGQKKRFTKPVVTVLGAADESADEVA